MAQSPEDEKIGELEYEVERLTAEALKDFKEIDLLTMQVDQAHAYVDCMKNAWTKEMDGLKAENGRLVANLMEEIKQRAYAEQCLNDYERSIEAYTREIRRVLIPKEPKFYAGGVIPQKVTAPGVCVYQYNSDCEQYESDCGRAYDTIETGVPCVCGKICVLHSNEKVKP